jgi:hypothetical protein
MGNAVGLSVLLLLVGLSAKFVHLGENAIAIWAVTYLVLAVFAWQAWHEKSAPKSARAWLAIAVGATLLGAASFMVDVSFGHAKNPSLSVLAAAQEAGGFFGFAFTVTVFPALLLVSVSGAARAAFAMRCSDA